MQKYILKPNPWSEQTLDDTYTGMPTGQVTTFIIPNAAMVRHYIEEMLNTLPHAQGVESNLRLKIVIYNAERHLA
jgi:hypothetical protein